MVAPQPKSKSTSKLADDYLSTTLPSLLPPIFEQVQHTTANHRKNLVALRKIHETCAKYTEETPRGIKLTGEKQFNVLFTDMVNRVLGVKKGVAVADRVVKFVASYVAYTTEYEAANRPEGSDEETTGSRFVNKLLKHLLSGMEAKDKNVRFRVTLLTVSMINGLGEMDDDLYVLLRKSLLDRSRDKEAAVRVQAALGLAKLQDGEDEEDLEEGEEALSQILLDLLQFDTAAEVRRAALYNLPRTPTNLPHILARTRDADPVLRRTVYHGSLSSTALPDARVMSIAQREEVVRNGLGDREGNVRKATAGMLGGWFDQAGCDVLEFLGRFDVVSSQVAEDALSSLFTSRPEVFHSIEFDEEYWNNLTPERAFLARVFVDHCITIKDTVRLEDSLPVVTNFAFRIQDQYNSLTSIAENEDAEAEISEKAFVIGELLKLAVNLDYADENGRRQMFSLTRDMLKEPNLPETLIPGCLDVLCKISNNERDFIRVVVEDVITDLREGEAEEDVEIPDSAASTYSTTPARRKGSIVPGTTADDPEAALKAALMDLRCLMICISLLERVNSALQDNSVFHGLLPDLIIPAVQNKEEPALREQGLVCLGLCCMLDAKIAKDSIGLFISQIGQGDVDLRVRVMRIILDLLMVHDVTGLVPADKSAGLIPHLLQQEHPEVQAVAVEGVAKLMLAGMTSNVEILQSLVLLYFSPETAENQPLRQCLAYFLPVYCYSASENQRRMLSIFSETFSILAELTEEVEEEGTMPPLAQMGLMIVDWLDPEKTVERDGRKPDQRVHYDLAVEIAKSLLSERSRDIRKALVSFLSKLNLPEQEDIPALDIQSLVYLFGAVKAKRPMPETASRNSLVKFDAALLKRYPDHLEGYTEEGFVEIESDAVQALVKLVDETEAREASPEAPTRRRGSSSVPKARRSKRAGSSMTATSNEGEDSEEEERPKRVTRGKVLNVVEEEDGEEEEGEDDEEEDDDDDEEEGEADEVADAGRAAIDDDDELLAPSEEEEEDEDEATPKPSRSRSSAPAKSQSQSKSSSARAKTKTKSAPEADKSPGKRQGPPKAKVPAKRQATASAKAQGKGASAASNAKAKAKAKGSAAAGKSGRTDTGRGKIKQVVEDSEEEDDEDVESMLSEMSEDPL